MAYADGMRASRLISVLLLLQTRGRMTAQQLACELEVSIRTVYRDVDELSASGIPVFAERGSNGGFQLVEGYRTKLTGLTPEEAEALFLSGYPGPAAELGLGTVLAAAQLKVLAALPPELRSRAARLRQRFHLDAPGWFQQPETAPHLQAIAEAVWSDKRLHMLYRRGDDDGTVVERVVDPLGLVLKAGVWYFVGCADGGPSGADQRRAGSFDASFRTYRVSRIVELTILPDRFERPEAFDLAEYWRTSVAAYQDSLPSFEATVRVRAGSIDRLSDAIGDGPAREAFAQDPAPDADGWATLRVCLEDLWHAETRLLAMGAEAEVLAPAELRERVANAARRAADLYR